MKFNTSEKLSAATSVACIGLMLGIVLDKSGIVDFSGSIHDAVVSATETKVPSNATAAIVYGDWQDGSSRVTAMCKALTPDTDGMNYSERKDFLDSEKVKTARKKAIKRMEVRASELQEATEDRIEDELGLDVSVDAHTSILCDTQRMGEEHVYKTVLGFSDNAWPNETICTFDRVDSADGGGLDVLNWTCESTFGNTLDVQTIYAPTGNGIAVGHQIAGTQ